MYQDDSFLNRTVILQSEKLIGGHRYFVEISAAKNKWYITCKQNAKCQVICLFSKQVLNVIGSHFCTDLEKINQNDAKILLNMLGRTAEGRVYLQIG